MHLVIIFGPPAVGKMTVGQALARATGLRLFHNHMALEPVLQIFEFDSPPFVRIVRSIRDQVFREVAGSNLPGLIYTCMWDLDDDTDRAYIDEVCALFRSNGAAVHFVELYATLEERLRRNRTAQRLAAKPSKRDVAASQARLLARQHDARLNTSGDFFQPELHLRIDNTARSAEQAAALIIERFGLPVVEPGADDDPAPIDA
jgi:hypothetical protein